MYKTVQGKQCILFMPTRKSGAGMPPTQTNSPAYSYSIVYNVFILQYAMYCYQMYTICVNKENQGWYATYSNQFPAYSSLLVEGEISTSGRLHYFHCQKHNFLLTWGDSGGKSRNQDNLISAKKRRRKSDGCFAMKIMLKKRKCSLL